MHIISFQQVPHCFTVLTCMPIYLYGILYCILTVNFVLCPLLSMNCLKKSSRIFSVTYLFYHSNISMHPCPASQPSSIILVLNLYEVSMFYSYIFLQQTYEKLFIYPMYLLFNGLIDFMMHYMKSLETICIYNILFKKKFLCSYSVRGSSYQKSPHSQLILSTTNSVLQRQKYKSGLQ